MNFEPRPVMPLEQLGDEIAHGVTAEIRGHVADADAIVTVAFHGREALWRRGHLALDPGAREGGLHRNLIGERQRGERAAARHQIVGRKAADFIVQDRPRAHALADVQPVLDDIRLLVLDRQAGAHRRLGVAQLAQLLQQAGTLVEQGDARVVLLQRVALGPAGEGRLRFAPLFQQQAEVDRGGGKAGPLRQCGAIAQDGVVGVSGMAPFRAKVEPGGMGVAPSKAP